MDGEMYEKIRNAYTLYAQIEADTANFIKAEFEDLAEQAHLVNKLTSTCPSSSPYPLSYPLPYSP